MDLSLFMPTRMICQAHAVDYAAVHLKALGRRCLLITGKSSAARSGALEEVERVLTAQGIAYEQFNGIGENPLLSACQKAGQQAASFHADFLIGIGGGSVLDATKAAAIYAANPSITGEDIYGLIHPSALPFCLIGTTAGTGSEVTPIAVLTSDRDGRKRSISDDSCFARLVIADWRYTRSMPQDVTVSTALDALCHAVEGYFSPVCNDILDLFAYQAFSLLGQMLPELEKSPLVLTDTQREQFYTASIYAGLVLSRCGTGFPHPLGYLLTEKYDLAHGRASAVFLPEYLSRAAQLLPERMVLFEDKSGASWQEISALIQRLHGFDRRLPEHVTDGFDQRFSGNKNFDRSPGGFSADLAVALYKKLFIS